MDDEEKDEKWGATEHAIVGAAVGGPGVGNSIGLIGFSAGLLVATSRQELDCHIREHGCVEYLRTTPNIWKLIGCIRSVPVAPGAQQRRRENRNLGSKLQR